MRSILSFVPHSGAAVIAWVCEGSTVTRDTLSRMAGT
jgi:hypothetical protein